MEVRQVALDLLIDRRGATDTSAIVMWIMMDDGCFGIQSTAELRIAGCCINMSLASHRISKS
jgi:hypothetical protein